PCLCRFSYTHCAFGGHVDDVDGSARRFTYSHCTLRRDLLRYDRTAVSKVLAFERATPFGHHPFLGRRDDTGIFTMQHGEQPGRASCADELNEAGGVLVEGGTHHEDFQGEASIVQHRNVGRTELIRIASRDMKYYVGDRLGFSQLCRLVQRSLQINAASSRKIN